MWVWQWIFLGGGDATTATPPLDPALPHLHISSVMLYQLSYKALALGEQGGGERVYTTIASSWCPLATSEMASLVSNTPGGDLAVALQIIFYRKIWDL